VEGLDRNSIQDTGRVWSGEMINDVFHWISTTDLFQSIVYDSEAEICDA